MTETSTVPLLLSELAQQLHRFFHHLDERRYESLIDLFTDDCRWLRQGRWIEGKQAVRDALQARPASHDTRHVMSNAFVTELSGNGARAVLEAYMTAYRYPAHAHGDEPPVIAGPLRFNLTTTAFRHEPARGWRIEEQRIVAAFAFAP